LRKTRISPASLPPPITGIHRVDSLQFLGVTFSCKLSISDHIDNVLVSCSKSLHALRTLRVHSMPDPLIHLIFVSKVLSKLTYCSPAWRGFCTGADIVRLDAFIIRAKKFNFCSANIPTFVTIFDQADNNLFKSVTSDSYHVLHHLLPPKITHTTIFAFAHSIATIFDLALIHMLSLLSCQLSQKATFFARMLYKQCY